MNSRTPKTDTLSLREGKSSEDIARRLKLDRGLGFLVRLLDTRVNVLYEQLTAQNDITPRQFGVLLTLYQQGTLTLTELAKQIRVDRSTLGEMINRMAERSLISKRNNGSDRRSAEVLLAPAGKSVLLRIVAGAAQLQTALLAPLAAEDRAHFMRCMKLVAEPAAVSNTDEG
jgi:DNA-binding MarR family transcriptional regulator